MPLPGDGSPVMDGATGSSTTQEPGAVLEGVQLESGGFQSAALLPEQPRFRLQLGSPVGLANFIDPEAGCNWMGVGGQAFDLNGNPITQLVVEVGGRLEGGDVFHLALSGSSAILGPGGFVVVLADHTVETIGSLWILLYDLAGVPLTHRTYFPTYADCTKNFILVNFAPVPANEQPRMVFPLIYK
jgi:hypothetical protein